jgi:gas vesicle protein
MFRGFVVGFIVGTILGLLTAPLSGERTRRIIRKEIEEFLERKRYIAIQENSLSARPDLERGREEFRIIA